MDGRVNLDEQGGRRRRKKVELQFVMIYVGCFFIAVSFF